MRDGRPLGPEGRGARARERVLEAAFSVVRERPLAEVQLRHIASRAGMSAGHVLYHFGSKDGILVETLRWSEDAIGRRRARELDAAEDPREALRRWIVLYLPNGADDPTWKLWLELWLRSGMDEDLSKIPRGIAERWIADLARILNDGVRSKVFEPVDEDGFMTRAHSLLIGLSIGVLVGWLELEEARSTAFEAIGKDLGCSLDSKSTGGGKTASRRRR